MPFTPQAPLANWADPRQEDGCEETSSLIAMMWVRDFELSPSEAEAKIIDIAEFESKNYGSYKDTDTQSTAERILKDYFNFSDYEVQDEIQKSDIIKALEDGRLVIAPMDGSKLENPYFSSPPPQKHMLVIIGYNPQADYFITHEPGTRRGAYFKYDAELLYNAIKNYPSTGKDEVSSEKSIILIEKVNTEDRE